jgi:hypothetical protein
LFLKNTGPFENEMIENIYKMIFGPKNCKNNEKKTQGLPSVFFSEIGGKTDRNLS